MIELVGSRVKVTILLYLGLRGGAAGRHLSRILKIAPSQVFKALHQLVDGGIVRRYKKTLYELNPYYLHHDELQSMLQKEAKAHPSLVHSFLPKIIPERKIDPISVYELLELRGSKSKNRLSDILRENYG